MKFVEPISGLELSVKEEFLKVLYECGMQHYPAEFGGLLVGRYSSSGQIAFIEETVLAQKFTGSEVHFDRGSDGLRDILSDLYNRRPSLGYLGEWHTHPNGPNQPSPTDKRAMQKIAKSKSVLIKNPILLILSINITTYKPAFFVQVADSLNRYQLIT